ncbi:hypothetical protein [uncultured Sphingomonas sp.]|jgi:hypothetical protein|uniref:hypothetical protein n=1 Tax=uncultured Sphingomonas sp. TaxID=158754 RepID=UPI00258A1231|nr:hypothetical protein [uncultured Sphingomonas sp.]
MLAVLAAFALLAQAAPPTPPSDDEIVVIGQRLRNIRITAKRDRRTGMTRCALKPSTGDPLLDTGICQAYLACLPNVRTGSEMEACMRPPAEREVAAWQQRRKAATAPR